MAGAARPVSGPVSVAVPGGAALFSTLTPFTYVEALIERNGESAHQSSYVESKSEPSSAPSL